MHDINPQTLDEVTYIELLVGKNILQFQDVELLLKEIHHFRYGEGTDGNLIKRKMRIDELSLGRLSDTAVLNKIDAKLSKRNDTEWHQAYDILKDYEPLDVAIKFFNSINADRNLLVHNFIAKWSLDEPENRTKATEWLLRLYNDACAQKEVLISSLNIITKRINIINEYFNSDKGKKEWDEFLSSDKLEITFSFQEQ